MTIVKILIEKGATPLKAKADGINILHITASSNDIHILDYVISLIKA
jgi:hypothetical protein